MPQMKPLLWLMTLLMTFFYFILLIAILYFTSFTTDPSFLPSKKNTPFIWMWKW